MNNINQAPRGPDVLPRWTSSAKTGVGTALQHPSYVWFTLSHGIFDEIYYPRVDQACVRDMGLLVADGKDFFSEEKRDAQSEVSFLAEGVPAYRLVNTCRQGRYRIDKEILSDPHREVVLQSTRFVPLKGRLEDYHLYVLLSPHLANRGSGNTAWLGEYKGHAMLFAQRAGSALALACTVPWLRRSVGFVGTSDGWQDISQHKQMEWSYERAEDGNIALAGEIDLQADNGSCVLALGFGHTPAEAGHRARASLLDGFDTARRVYLKGWQDWQQTLQPLEKTEASDRDLYRTSTAVLRIHEAKHFPGGAIASLSIPWGFSKGDDDLGGYHLVWPRDLCETAGGLLAAGALDDARRMLRFLQFTQEADGHWPQNMWLDGSPYWDGIQMDETAFPIWLLDLCRREAALEPGDLERFWPMARRAAGFLVRNGPVTQEDRWEEDAGYSPFTLAVEIAALSAAANLAKQVNDAPLAQFLNEVADNWYSHIDDWIYTTDTALARQAGVSGYYMRIASPEQAEASSPSFGYVTIRNRPLKQSQMRADQVISPDALALVRFGLRAADDPRIVNTVKLIDRMLKKDTPAGPCWYRYNDDGYGEHDDGSPFDGTGTGRLWPLLTGERAHYELAAGRRPEAVRLLRALEAFANEGRLLPEQVWDKPDIPGKELFFGRPSGSAMPLVWAHSEYIKLRRSLRDGRVFDLGEQVAARYASRELASPQEIWAFNQKPRSMKAGKTLIVKLLAPAMVHFSLDGGPTTHDLATQDTGLGVHIARLPTRELPPGATVKFTFTWPQAGGKREPDEFAVTVK